MNPDGRLLTVREIADYLRVNPMTVYKWTSQVRIPCIKFSGRCVRFELEKVKRWFKTMEQKGRATRQIPVERYSDPWHNHTRK
jgi:excisionase family DNA binding protein